MYGYNNEIVLQNINPQVFSVITNISAAARGANNYQNKDATTEHCRPHFVPQAVPYTCMRSTCVPRDVPGRRALSRANGRDSGRDGPFALRAELSPHYYIDNEIWRYCAFCRRPHGLPPRYASYRPPSLRRPLSKIKTAARPPATSASRYYCGSAAPWVSPYPPTRERGRIFNPGVHMREISLVTRFVNRAPSLCIYVCASRTRPLPGLKRPSILNVAVAYLDLEFLHK